MTAPLDPSPAGPAGTVDTSEGVVRRRRVYLDDIDAYGMLNNTVYPRIFDQAILDFWMDAGWEFDAATSVLAVRELSVDYHRPVLGIGDVDVQIRIARVGRTSVTYHLRMLSPDHAVVHAEGTRTLVNLDPATLRPTPLDARMWDVAEPLLAAGVERPAA
jgi:acyl-CoA thioester hydrolase